MPKKPIAYRGGEPFVFVSYAHADAELAYPIISGLQDRGLRVWFDDGMDVGDIWEDVIPDHVEQCAAMLCLVSTRFTDSNNCLDEIHYAKEQKKKLMILHIEDEELPRIFQFRYGRYNAERLSGYSDRNVLLDKLVATEKLRCCLGEAKSVSSEESPEEIYQKGEAFYNGNGVPQSYEEAVKWYQKAADLGHLAAMRKLGLCYDRGHGVSKSREEAVTRYRWAAEKGDAIAMRNLGICYTGGRGVVRSYEKAVTWFRWAAEKGDAIAMRNLGICYANGRGVVQSHEKAVAWYHQAAGKGDAAAMCNIGDCYRYGQGVSYSEEEMATWYRRAADMGNTRAMNKLCECYTYGRGVAKDNKQADYWKSKAENARRNPFQ